MASIKDDKFMRFFDDFVSYLNCVEPFDAQSGILDARIGFVSREGGILSFWMHDCIIGPDEFDQARYSAIFDRVDRFVRDLNVSHSFADDKIARLFDLYDQDGQLRFGVMNNGR